MWFFAKIHFFTLQLIASGWVGKAHWLRVFKDDESLNSIESPLKRSDYFLKTKVQVPWKKKTFPVYNKGVWWNIDSQIITTAREPGPWHAMIYEH